MVEHADGVGETVQHFSHAGSGSFRLALRLSQQIVGFEQLLVRCFELLAYRLGFFNLLFQLDGLRLELLGARRERGLDGDSLGYVAKYAGKDASSVGHDLAKGDFDRNLPAVVGEDRQLDPLP